jgi:hypothetical protein
MYILEFFIGPHNFNYLYVADTVLAYSIIASCMYRKPQSMWLNVLDVNIPAGTR